MPRLRSSFKEPRQALALTSRDNHYSLTPGCRERGEEGRIHHTLGDRRQRLTSWRLLCTSDTQESSLRAYHSQAARLQGNQSSQPDPSLFTGSRVYDLGAQKKVCSYRGDKGYPRTRVKEGGITCFPRWALSWEHWLIPMGRATNAPTKGPRLEP